jgi:hypothetical protein
MRNAAQWLGVLLGLSVLFTATHTSPQSNLDAKKYADALEGMLVALIEGMVVVEVMALRCSTITPTLYPGVTNALKLVLESNKDIVSAIKGSQRFQDYQVKFESELDSETADSMEKLCRDTPWLIRGLKATLDFYRVATTTK